MSGRKSGKRSRKSGRSKRSSRSGKRSSRSGVFVDLKKYKYKKIVDMSVDKRHRAIDNMVKAKRVNPRKLYWTLTKLRDMNRMHGGRRELSRRLDADSTYVRSNYLRA